jgi:NADH-quinone oxidoreductase subunit N
MIVLGIGILISLLCSLFCKRFVIWSISSFFITLSGVLYLKDSMWLESVFSFSSLIWMYFVKDNLRSLPKEWSILLLAAIFGTTLAFNTCDIKLIWVGIEIQAISIYILCSSDRHIFPRYFIYGVISSALFAYGAALVYLSCKTLCISNISIEAIESNIASFGIICIAASFAIKLALAPFHFWASSVYSEINLSLMGWMSTSLKLGNLIIFGTFIKHFGFCNKICLILGSFSMIVGSIMGLTARSLKTLIAYSGTLSMGFAMLSMQESSGYLMWIFYCINTTILCFYIKERNDRFEYLNGLGCISELWGFVISLCSFSMIGIPPLSGFFGKFSILKDLVMYKMYKYIFLFIIASMISSIFYLRIIKLIYIEQPIHKENAPILSAKKFSLFAFFLFIALFARVIF